MNVRVLAACSRPLARRAKETTGKCSNAEQYTAHRVHTVYSQRVQMINWENTRAGSKSTATAVGTMNGSGNREPELLKCDWRSTPEGIKSLEENDRGRSIRQCPSHSRPFLITHSSIRALTPSGGAIAVQYRYILLYE